MEDFEAWYRAQHPQVLAACAALSGDLDAAREATDEAFTRALERWATVASMAAPGGWVQTVALNVLRRTLRRRRFLSRSARGRDAVRSADRAGGAGRADAGVELPDADLWAAVRTLPPRQQTAVVLRYVHDLPEAEIAGSMGITRGTVASTLAAARSTLGRRLGDRDRHEESVHG